VQDEAAPAVAAAVATNGAMDVDGDDSDETSSSVRRLFTGPV